MRELICRLAIGALLGALAVAAGPAAAQPGGVAFLVADINPNGDAAPSNLTDVGGKLFFVADDGASGRELWQSDGSAGGTRRVADINPGAGSAFVPGSAYPDSFANQLTAAGGKLYFVADDGASGRELWQSDGSAGGTRRVADINPGAGAAEPIYLTMVNDRLFFVADDGASGRELWQSDGSAGGTRKVKDIRADADPLISSLVESSGRLFFAANMATELWTSDGTLTGTLRLGGFSYVANLRNVGDVLFFEAETADCPVHGLWKSDGTPAGTVLVACVGGLVREALAVGPTLFFLFDDPALETPYELWRSDGTPPGTARVTGYRFPLPPDNLIDARGTLFFDACLELTPPDNTPAQCALWRSDGTPAGTVAVSAPFGTSLSNLASVEGQVFFTAPDDSAGRELWASDGRPHGTRRMQDIAPGPASGSPAELTVAGPLLFFSASSAAGRELWAARLADLRSTVAHLPLALR